MSAENVDHTQPNRPEIIRMENIFPIAYGNEEETGLLDDTIGEMNEPYKLAASLRRYVPRGLQGTSEQYEIFLRNGSKIYVGGGRDRYDSEEPDGQAKIEITNIERATQECVDPSQLALAIRAAERLGIKTVENYVQQESAEQRRRVRARIQRRTVDGRGERKGCHDNFGLATHAPFVELFWGRNRVPDDIMAYAASRSIIDGAGYASPNGPRFSQKIGGLKSLYNYGYEGSMFRFSSSEGNPRVEVRHSDINISEWAIRMRVGGMALALALTQTPLAEKLPQIEAKFTIEQAKLMNRLALNEDGTIDMEPTFADAINIQQQMAETVMSRLGLYVDEIPEELLWVAHERYTFCDDLRRVASGQATVALLRDRADWAAKFDLILSRLERDKKAGLPRSLTDFKSMAGDMRYDFIEISAVNGKLARQKTGTGYQLRDMGKFKGGSFTPRQVQAAYTNPLPGTRAELRGHLLKHYDVAACNWSRVTVEDDGQKFYFDLGDVSRSTFSELEQDQLSNIKRVSG